MIEQSMHHEKQLPPITPGEIVRETPNFQIVTDYKPGLENLPLGERFYIEPLTSEGSVMLTRASIAHNIYNFEVRPHPYNSPGHEYAIPCLRADYIHENVSVLLHGEVHIPKPGENTIPSPDRMEECIDATPKSRYGRLPSHYTFSNDVVIQIPNPQTRNVRQMQATHLDAIPDRVIHSADENPYYKVRKGWWLVVVGRLRRGIESGEFSDPSLLDNLVPHMNLWESKEFSNPHRLTTAEDIASINQVINFVWQTNGNKF